MVICVFEQYEYNRVARSTARHEAAPAPAPVAAQTKLLNVLCLI